MLNVPYSTTNSSEYKQAIVKQMVSIVKNRKSKKVEDHSKENIIQSFR